MTNKNHDISITKVPVATKLDRIMTFLDVLLGIKSHGPLITWPCEITQTLKVSE